MTSTIPLTVTPTTPEKGSTKDAKDITLTVSELNAVKGGLEYRSGPDLVNATVPMTAGGTVDPPVCSPALRGLQNASVSGSQTHSFHVVEFVTLGDTSLPENGRRQDDFVQVAAVYKDQEAAQKVFTTLHDGVESCGERTVLDVEPGETENNGKKYILTVGKVSSDSLRWTQHRTDWGVGQECLLEVRKRHNIIVQDIECGIPVNGEPVGQLLSRALDKTVSRIT